MRLDPGDVHLHELEAVFFGIEEVRAMALDGYSLTEIAQANGWRNEDIRTAARIMGFTINDLVPHYALCPRCGHITDPDGTCNVCLLTKRLERMGAAYPLETQRATQRLLEDINRLKTEIKRKRIGFAVEAAAAIVGAMLDFKAVYLLNPRMRREEWQDFERAAGRLLAVAQAQARTVREEEHGRREEASEVNE